MIGKVSVGNSFGGIVNYLLNEKKNPEILDSNGVMLESKESIIESFNYQRSMNRNLGKAVWHSSISFAYLDKVDTEIMKQVANDYIKEIGLGGTQFLVVKHNDRQHKHLHILANRVDNVGDTVSDSFAANRTVKIMQSLEKSYELTVAKDNTNQRKKELKNTIKDAIENGDTLDQVFSKVEKIGYEVLRNKDKNNKVTGVSYSMKSKGLIWKASQVDRSLSYLKMQKSIEELAIKNVNIESTFIEEGQISIGFNERSSEIVSKEVPPIEVESTIVHEDFNVNEEFKIEPVVIQPETEDKSESLFIDTVSEAKSMPNVDVIEDAVLTGTATATEIAAQGELGLNEKPSSVSTEEEVTAKPIEIIEDIEYDDVSVEEKGIIISNNIIPTIENDKLGDSIGIEGSDDLKVLSNENLEETNLVDTNDNIIDNLKGIETSTTQIIQSQGELNEPETTKEFGPELPVNYSGNSGDRIKKEVPWVSKNEEGITESKVVDSNSKMEKGANQLSIFGTKDKKDILDPNASIVKNKISEKIELVTEDENKVLSTSIESEVNRNWNEAGNNGDQIKVDKSKSPINSNVVISEKSLLDNSLLATKDETIKNEILKIESGDSGKNIIPKSLNQNKTGADKTIKVEGAKTIIGKEVTSKDLLKTDSKNEFNPQNTNTIEGGNLFTSNKVVTGIASDLRISRSLNLVSFTLTSTETQKDYNCAIPFRAYIKKLFKEAFYNKSLVSVGGNKIKILKEPIYRKQEVFGRVDSIFINKLKDLLIVNVVDSSGKNVITCMFEGQKAHALTKSNIKLGSNFRAVVVPLMLSENLFGFKTFKVEKCVIKNKSTRKYRPLKILPISFKLMIGFLELLEYMNRPNENSMSSFG